MSRSPPGSERNNCAPLLATARRGGHRHEVSAALFRFYDWCAEAEIGELTTLAETVEAWWPENLAFLHTKITNAGTEGTNRLTKQVKRGAFNRPRGRCQGLAATDCCLRRSTWCCRLAMTRAWRATSPSQPRASASSRSAVASSS